MMMIIMTPAYYTIQRVETYRYDKRAITHKSAATPGRGQSGKSIQEKMLGSCINQEPYISRIVHIHTRITECILLSCI